MSEGSIGDRGLVAVAHVERLQLRQMSEGSIRDRRLVTTCHHERAQLRQVREGRIGDRGLLAETHVEGAQRTKRTEMIIAPARSQTIRDRSLSRERKRASIHPRGRV